MGLRRFYYRMPPTHGAHSSRPIDNTKAQKGKRKRREKRENETPEKGFTYIGGKQPLNHNSNQSERARIYTAVRLNMLLLYQQASRQETGKYEIRRSDIAEYKQ